VSETHVEKPDDEELADLATREASEHDPSRSRRTIASLASWTPSPDVDAWPCRRCDAATSVPQATVDAAATFDAILASRHEAPLDRARIMLCATCAARAKREEFERARAASDRLSSAIEAVKRSPPRDPEEEREAIRGLEIAGHPEASGCVAAIMRASKAASRRSSREALDP